MSIRSFPRGSAGGLSGLRPQHLQDALTTGTGHEFLRQLTALCNLLLRGGTPHDVGAWLLGAKLAALPKPDATLRPIAVGEVLRRLVGKAAATEAAPDLRAFLEPVQLGVGSKFGCERVVHVARQWLGRNRNEEDKVLLLLDMANAFNTIDRTAVMSATRRICPGLAPWVDSCYMRDSVLLLDTHQLNSSRGVQQGDPLGPALFALGIHEDILQARAAAEARFPGELEWTAFFLDDGTAAGSARAVRLFAEDLRARLRAKGLDVNLDKCDVIPTAGTQTLVQVSDFPGMRFVTDGNFKLLGAAFGEDSSCQELIRKRTAKAHRVLQAAGDLTSVQSGYLLTKHCAGFCKLAYASRVIPPQKIGPALHEFSDNLKETLQCLLGESLGEREWAQANLGIKQGGVGIRDPIAHAWAAFVASFLNCRSACKELDPTFDELDSEGWAGARAAVAAFNELVEEDDKVDTQGGNKSQRQLSSAIDKSARNKLVSSHTFDPFYRAHLNLVTELGAGAWLTALPEDPARNWDSTLFRIALKRRLRVRVQAGDTPCPCCGGIMDSYGDHALTCPCKGDRTTRHNCIRDIAFEDAVEAKLNPEREKAHLLPQRPHEDGVHCKGEDEGRRPADIWLPRGAGRTRGKPEALDFAITSGLRADRVSVAISEPSRLFAEYEESKNNYKDTKSKCEREGFIFTPLVIEAHGGGLSAATRRILDHVAKQQSVAGVFCKEGASLRIAQRISTALHRANARAILKRLAGAPSRPEFTELGPDSDGED